MVNCRKWFVILVVAWVILGTIIVSISIALGRGDFFSHAEFTEFFVCAGPGFSTDLPQKPMAKVSPSMKTLYVCGYLEVSSRVPLNFLFYYDGTAMAWLGSEEYYHEGYVYKEVPQKWRQKAGRYRVEAWLTRRRLASAEFVVEP